MRPAHVIPGSREVEDVLATSSDSRSTWRSSLDEYGGTAGIVTMEDLLEEIVGEILDEYDEAEAPQPLSRREGELVVAGSTNIGELNGRYELKVPEEDYTTIGGYVFGALGRVPVVGDRVTAGGATFTVRDMEGRRVETLGMEISRRPIQAADREAPTSRRRAIGRPFFESCPPDPGPIYARSWQPGARAARPAPTTSSPCPRGSNSGMFASSYAFTAMTVAACRRSPSTAWSYVSACEWWVWLYPRDILIVVERRHAVGQE